MTTEINKALVAALQQCDTKELVEDIFARFSISSYLPKTDHLVAAMGNPELFFSDGGKDVEVRYFTVLSMFLTAEWKINELYKKMGFQLHNTEFNITTVEPLSSIFGIFTISDKNSFYANVLQSGRNHKDWESILNDFLALLQ